MDDEKAKAIQEVAKAGGKAIDAVAQVGGFISKVIGNAAVEAGESLHDWVNFFRYKNLLQIQDKVEALHAKRQLEGKSIPIPPRYAIPLIAGASEEDDDSIQDLWAGLIANATDPQKCLVPKRIFSSILSSLEPLDARLLRYLNTQGWKMFKEVPGGGVNVPTLSAELRAPKQEVQLSLQNLYRLGCVIDEYQLTYDEIGSSSAGIRVQNEKATFRPSPLGFDLLAACGVAEKAGDQAQALDRGAA